MSSKLNICNTVFKVKSNYLQKRVSTLKPIKKYDSIIFHFINKKITNENQLNWLISIRESYFKKHCEWNRLMTVIKFLLILFLIL